MTHSIDIKTFPSKDPRLAWKSVHDSRSLKHLVAPRLVASTVLERPRDFTLGPVLDQGYEGACVGFGWTAELVASPKPDPYTTADQGNLYARGYYRRCLQVDEYEGEEDEGTSVLAGAKVSVERRYNGAFGWCRGAEEVRQTLLTDDRSIAGPVVIGIPWYEGMYEPRPSGLIEVDGDLVGGHCMVVYGYHPSMRIPGEDWHKRFRVFKVRNSWGTSYGKGGNAYLRYEDLRDLLRTWGEACIPMQRGTVRLQKWQDPA